MPNPRDSRSGAMVLVMVKYASQQCVDTIVVLFCSVHTVVIVVFLTMMLVLLCLMVFFSTTDITATLEVTPSPLLSFTGVREP